MYEIASTNFVPQVKIKAVFNNTTIEKNLVIYDFNLFYELIFIVIQNPKIPLFALSKIRSYRKIL